MEGQANGTSAATTVGWRPVLSSALVPGTGQLTMDQDRGWVYLAVEAGVWVGYGMSRHAGMEDRTAYRDLAWREARGEVEPRRDGDFEYFERLGAWTRSGAFDAEPGSAGLQPETDPATFNGDAWELARDLVGLPPDAGPEDPRYRRALELYEERAYPSDLTWDWTGSPEARERYRSLVQESDQHLRQSTTLLGGIFLNHVVSAVDAYVSQASGSALRLQVEPERVGPEVVPYLTLRVFHP
jgi:hypothetical protein